MAILHTYLNTYVKTINITPFATESIVNVIVENFQKGVHFSSFASISTKFSLLIMSGNEILWIL